MKREAKWLAAGVLTLLLVASAAVRPAVAYFTTYTENVGGLTLTMSPDVEIEEKAEQLTKDIQIKNTGSAPVWVRVMIYYPGEKGFSLAWEDVKDEQGESVDAEGVWTYDGGYWNYSKMIAPEKLTGTLKVTITPPDKYKADFDVQVLVEYTAKSTTDTPPKADWNAKVSAGS